MKPSIDYGREDIVKFLYLEPLLMGQRVLVVGPESDVVKQVFQRMGCKAVKLIRPGGEAKPDWDLASLRGKRDSLEAEKRLLPYGVGSFDIIFIPDLAALEDYRMVLAECSRIAAQGGLVIISARNAECTASISQSGLEETPDIWSLESLEELTRTYFEHVENVGQCPFLAYACVSFDPERVAEGVRLDTSLMDERSEEPEFYLILCSRKPLQARLSNAVYQVPMTEMTLAEAPETASADAGAAEAGTPPPASVRNENEMLRKEVAEKNVLVARLKKELERVEGEAEERRQKMFDMKQKMEQERKAAQKEVLEKAIQKQVDRIPETWMGEREAMVREMEQLKKDCRILRTENKKMEAEIGAMKRESKRPPPQDRSSKEREWKRDRDLLRGEIDELRRENRRLANENRALRDDAGSPKAEPARPGAGAAGGEVEKLRRELEARERLVRDLLLEMELMPQVGFGDDVPSGEEDVLEVVGKMEEMRKSIIEGGETAARLKARNHELELTLQEERVRASAAARENESLHERIKELLATVNMMKDLCESSPEKDAEALNAAAARLDAVVHFCLDELKRLSESRVEESIGRELALLWARVEEKRRLARGAAAPPIEPGSGAARGRAE